MPSLPRSESLSSLLSLPNSQFVQSCYQAILLREIDPEGLSHSLARLLAGEDKLSVAADIASSDEARALPATSKGLAMEVLALQAESLVRRAWTPKQRDAAARRIHRYFTALAEPNSNENAAEKRSCDDGDPFSAYLENVINDRNC